MHFKRLIIAVLFLPFFYFYIMYLPPEYFLFLLIVFSTIALAEYYAMFKVKGLIKYTGLLLGILMPAVFFLKQDYFIDILFMAVLIIAAIRLVNRKDLPEAPFQISMVLLGLLYLPGLLTFQLTLVKMNPAWIVLLFATVWIADSFAYYVGSSIGKRKLYKDISPHKTVEGGVGSLCGGIAGAVLVKGILLKHIPVERAIVIGIVLGAVTIIGDLVESLFKRSAGIKDSSALIPGHGGVLDKIDGVTFAGPVLYWLGLSLGLFR
jgi:phosphatidate cytidylyltransferase